MSLFRSGGTDSIFNTGLSKKPRTPVREDPEDDLDVSATAVLQNVSKNLSVGDGSALTSSTISAEEIDPHQKQELEKLLSKYSASSLLEKNLTTSALMNIVTRYIQLSPKANINIANLLHRESMVFVKKESKGYFKERFAELKSRSLNFYRTSQKDGKKGVYPLDTSFSVQILGNIPIQAKNVKREKKSLKASVFVLIFKDKSKKDLILAIADEQESEEWIEVLNLLEIMNFASLPLVFPLNNTETLQSKIQDEFNLFKEEKSAFIAKYGQMKFDELTEDYLLTVDRMKPCPF